MSTSFTPNFFTGPMMPPSPTASAAAAANTSFSSPNFDGQGHDFLSPKTVLGDVHDFAGSIKPVTTQAPYSVAVDPYGKNPKSTNVLRNTSNTLNKIMSPNFGQNLFPTANTTMMPGGNGGAVLNPNGLGATPSAGGGMPLLASNGAVINNTTTVLSQPVQTPSPALLYDLQNFNPLIWHNPSASNVLLGIMDSQNKIYGGNGIFSPHIFNQFPLYPYISQPTAPFSQFQIPVPGSAPVNNHQQALMFPMTYVTGSPGFYTQWMPYAIAQTQSISTYQGQVNLNNAMLNQLNQLENPNGVPPWI